MAILKLLHLLFVFSWMGSLLMLTRFLSYLPKEEKEVQNRLLTLLKRVYLFVDCPAMILGLVSGVVLFIWKGVDFSHGWLHMKLTFVFFLVVCDILLGRAILKPQKSQRGVRHKILHGMAALCLIAILFSVYVIKNKVGSDSSLAKKGDEIMISTLKQE